MVNFFATPLKLKEWIAGVVSLGWLKMLVTVGFAAALAWILYVVNIFAVGWMFLPFMVLLLMTGWWVGFLVSGLIISFGTRIQTLAWAGVYALAPFSGIFYPISSLPVWAQRVAQFVPSSYVFEGMRQVLLQGTWSARNLILSLGLNLIYLAISMGLFVWLFKMRKIKGLAQLE